MNKMRTVQLCAAEHHPERLSVVRQVLKLQGSRCTTQSCCFGSGMVVVGMLRMQAALGSCSSVKLMSQVVSKKSCGTSPAAIR